MVKNKTTGYVRYLDMELFLEEGKVIFVHDRVYYDTKLMPHKVILKDGEVLYIPVSFSLDYFKKLYRDCKINLIPECLY